MDNTEVLECQKRMMVDLIESYFIELLRKGKSWGDHIIPCQTWEKIATTLNEMGPQHKNAADWKFLYEKMKSDAKQKVGAQRSYINKTGSGLPSVQLSNVDIKITSLYGKNHFDGLQGLRECGFPGRKFISNPWLNDIPNTPLQSANLDNATSGLPSRKRGKKRKLDSATITADTCGLCAGPDGNIECRICTKKMCVQCDDAYHRHPLRHGHNRINV